MIFGRRPNNFNVLTRIAGTVEDKKILDFGGNQGNLLFFSNGSILEKNYTSLDVDIDSLVTGAKEFPGAEWVHWNQHHPLYNPTGFKKQFPITDRQFDIIWAHSVFTHLDIQETLYCLDQLLKLKGEIIFSLVSTKNKRIIAKLLEIQELILNPTDITSIANSKYAVVLDRKNLLLNTTTLSEIKYTRIWAFYSLDFFLDLISDLVKKYSRSVTHTVLNGWDWIIIK
jgi:2-polyprenyl-3-methyl-5-hydroxy-6-metoxy-1,4-benzoquinol methylase